MDNVSKEKRSQIMSKIRGKNTTPEIKVRSLLHRLGFRFRIHKKNLPGKPDIVLAKYKAVIFVNGCFWHGHQGCKISKIPKSNTDFWTNKIQRNIEHDELNIAKLLDAKWRVLVIWECEINREHELTQKILSFLKPSC